MKVTFAYPYQDESGSYEPDQSAELDDDLARRLLNDGKVRVEADGSDDAPKTARKSKES